MIDCASNPARQNGFTLVEVLVAFLILTFSLGAVYESFSLGSSGIARAEHQAQALMLAQSALERTGVETPLVSGETVTSPATGFEVKVRVAPFVEATDHSITGLQLYEVEVSTQWQDRANLRQLSLHSLKWATLD